MSERLPHLRLDRIAQVLQEPAEVDFRFTLVSRGRVVIAEQPR